MAIPKDILAVQRPSSTVVKQRGTRFVVVKRTSKRVGNRVVPVDIGTVGEIIDGRFVERKPESPRKKTIDIKDYGEVALCNKHGKDLLDELARVWDLNDAKRLYTIALLRAAYGDIKNRDLLLQYCYLIRIRNNPWCSSFGRCGLCIPSRDRSGLLDDMRVHEEPDRSVCRQEHCR